MMKVSKLKTIGKTSFNGDRIHHMSAWCEDGVYFDAHGNRMQSACWAFNGGKPSYSAVGSVSDFLLSRRAERVERGREAECFGRFAALYMKCNGQVSKRQFANAVGFLKNWTHGDGGYVGGRVSYGMSRSAAKAHEDNLLTISAMPGCLRAVVKAAGIVASEWHHTGYFRGSMNRTYFFKKSDFE